MSTSRALFLCAAAGLAGGMSFAPLPFGILAFVAFIPLIVVLETSASRWKTLLYLYVFFFCFHGAANWWVSSWQKEADPFLMAAGIALWIGHPLFLMPGFLFYRYVRGRLGRSTSLILLPFLWVAVEWLHSLGEASYPWLVLGYTQVYHNTVIQVADVAGVWGVSFFVMAVNAALAHYFLRRMESKHFERESLVRHGTVVLLLTAIPCVYGLVRLHDMNTAPSTGGVTIGLVQPNVNPWQKWEGSVNEQVTLHQHLQDSLNAKTYCDVSLWSETAVPVGLLRMSEAPMFSLLQQWADSSRTTLVTGFADFVYYQPLDDVPTTARRFAFDTTVRYDAFNSSCAISHFTPTANEVSVHHKSRLTPFGERLPYADYLAFATNWFEWGVGISGWQLGDGAHPLPVPILRDNGMQDSILLGTIICIESIYPDYVADFVRRGATVLSVMTNDGWYDGYYGPEQHYCIAQMRAVETRRYVARCANTGVSGIISPAGTTVIRAPKEQALAIAGVVFPRTDVSLYVRFGDWLPKFSTVMLLMAFALSWYKRQSIRRT